MDASAGLSPRARLLLPVLLVALIGLSVHRLACSPAVGPYVELAGPTMGTSYSVKVADPDLSPDDQRRIGERIAARLARVNALMSTWITDSELSRFNAAPAGEPFPVASETITVFEIARQVSERSQGAFDVTVGPLVDAWGFGSATRPERTPDPALLATLMDGVDFRRVRIDREAGTLQKADDRTRCDLSAIAKGYGVDAIAELLDSMGHHDYLVEIGGELRAAGTRVDGRVWRVAIERPEAGQTRSVQEILELRDQALATSGDYRNYYEEDGVRLSHTIDPRDGRPIRHGLASVSVIHREAVWADAWATALNVLGPEEGYHRAMEEQIAAFFIVRDSEAADGSPGGFRTRATPAFRSLQPAVDPDPRAAGAAPLAPEAGSPASH